VFNRLSYDHQLEIAQLLLVQEIDLFRGHGYELFADETVVPLLVQHGFHPRLGARPMRDAVEKLLGDAVATNLLQGGSGCGKLSVADTTTPRTLGDSLLKVLPEIS
jgi:ATP-dependent Clp protease ATP-binding subunit ClpA